MKIIQDHPSPRRERPCGWLALDERLRQPLGECLGERLGARLGERDGGRHAAGSGTAAGDV